MKLIAILTIGLFAVSCSSVQRVSGNTYKCEANSMFGSCEEKMKNSCPSGHKIESQDSVYGFGGYKDIIYYSCLKS
ncbi:hypothetical protein ABMA75_03135 [Halobacteriovorax sp. ZH4_bin.1]|uniref:hypothetical protein n=1 Tax=unclassified Halobacteriovorax TaxID=2639665 RepID=UPI0037146230